MQSNPHVKLVYTAIGGGSAGADPFAPQGAAEVRKATLTINMTHRDDRGGSASRTSKASCASALAVLPGARVKVGFGGSSEKYVLVLAGEDGAALSSHAAQVERELRTIPGIGNVTSTSSLVRPELIVRPDFARAADLGVTSAAIADTLRIATAGDYDQGLPKLNLSQRQVPVVVRLPAEARHDLELLSRLPVPGARGPVPLRQRRDHCDRQRPGADRPLRPAAQHQLRDRAEPAAARRGRAGGDGAAEPARTCRPA